MILLQTAIGTAGTGVQALEVANVYTAWLIIGALSATITAMALYIMKLHIGSQKVLQETVHENTSAMTDNAASNRELRDGIKELRQMMTSYVINNNGS